MGRPRVLIDVGIFANGKFSKLPSNRHRLGWFWIVCEAKQQDREGAFASLAVAKLRAGPYRDCVGAYIDAGLLHDRERMCDRCRRRFGSIPSEAIVVHDWQDYQEKSRTTQWREAVGLSSGHASLNGGNEPGNTGETPGKPHAHARPRAASVSESESGSPPPGSPVDEATAREALAALRTPDTAIFGLSEEETRLFAFLARFGASIRPDSGFGRRLLGVVERRGIDAVLAEAGRMSRSGPLSDRQWVFGLEAALEPAPNAKDVQTAAAEEARQVKARRAREETWRRRVEAYRYTGQWSPEWGEPPKVEASA
jgi:hypothetical protein